jgi:hypothetical protein
MLGILREQNQINSLFINKQLALSLDPNISTPFSIKNVRSHAAHASFQSRENTAGEGKEQLNHAKEPFSIDVVEVNVVLDSSPWLTATTSDQGLER